MDGNPLWSVLTYTFLPVATMVIGGAVAAFRAPGSSVRSYIQHFTAGVVFSVVAVEVLPEVRSRAAPLALMLGFSLGVGVMLSFKWLSQQLEQGGETAVKRRMSLLATVAVDVFIDGFLIGIGFTIGAKEGKLLTLALATEALVLGLAVSAALGKAGATRGRSIGLVSLMALLLAVGAALGTTLLRELSNVALEIVLSFGLAALLYLVTEELLVEAHEEPETPLTAATFFAGFLLFVMLGILG